MRPHTVSGAELVQVGVPRDGGVDLRLVIFVAPNRDPAL